MSMTGTYTSEGNTVTHTDTIARTDRTDASTGYKLTGTIGASFTVDTSSTLGPFTGTSTASLALSGSPVATESWNVSIEA